MLLLPGSHSFHNHVPSTYYVPGETLGGERQDPSLEGVHSNLCIKGHTKVLGKQIPNMVNGLLFPTKSAARCSQQEIGFIYKNHNSKLTFVGLPTSPPPFPSAPQDILLPEMPQ